LMLMIFSFTVKKTIPTYIYPALQLLICGVFFWSGIFKFNQLYFSEVVAWFAKPFNGSIFVQSLGLLLPVLEVFTAIGLLLIKTRKAAIITAIVVHLYYLLVTGPLGNNFNTVLWPWSFAMPLFVLLLFSGKHSYFSQNLTGFFHLNITKATLVLAWIIPIFNLFNIWPAYTSFNIYSGNTNNGILYLSDQTELMLPETVGKLVKNNTINIKEWSMQELNVPAFPEKRIFLKTRNYMMDFATDSSEVVLFYQPKTKLYGTSVAENY
ncbi:MAG: hypothetical protein M3Q58_11060, partial [Bacteroidota bacterium]|nr:hypothetical protein [Bacteroidota bacterium]